MDKRLTQEEIGFLNQMVVTTGWKVFQDMLSRKFQFEMLNLRKSYTDENRFKNTQGVLDGLEYAMTIVDKEVEEFEAQNDQQPA
jgi:hypothetical protein